MSNVMEENDEDCFKLAKSDCIWTRGTKRGVSSLRGNARVFCSAVSMQLPCDGSVGAAAAAAANRDEDAAADDAAADRDAS